MLTFLTAYEEGLAPNEMHHRPHGDDRRRAEPRGETPDAPKRHRAEDSAEASSGLRVPRALAMALLKGLASSPPEDGAAAVAAAEERENERKTLQTAHRIVYGVKTVLPKTTETIDLLERTLISLAELPEPPDDRPRRRAKVVRKTEEILRARSVTWVIGTSLAFEFLVLAAAAWIFCRRDY